MNSTLPAGGRTLCGAPPLCVEWPRPLPLEACHPTWSSPTVPHTFPAASPAHQVSIYIFHSSAGVFATFYLTVKFSSLLTLLIWAGGKGTPASSTPATSSPPPTLSDDFPIISLPASTVQSSPPRKVWLFFLWNVSSELMTVMYPFVDGGHFYTIFFQHNNIENCQWMDCDCSSLVCCFSECHDSLTVQDPVPAELLN